jgi:hypothetical protein
MDSCYTAQLPQILVSLMTRISVFAFMMELFLGFHIFVSLGKYHFMDRLLLHMLRNHGYLKQMLNVVIFVSFN